MKNYMTLVIALFAINFSFAQFYVSPSIGYGTSANSVLMGTSLNDSKTKATNHYGSYGEGMNVQFRAGYEFNETFGVMLGFSYLDGADQNISSFLKNDAGTIKEITEGNAHGEVFGLTAALTYNFNNNFYGRMGMVTKVGGKTVADFTRTTPTPLGPIVAKGVNEYHGRFPLGFTGAFGYKHNLGGNWNLFAEVEYLGINVTRDNSEFASLAIAYPGVPANALFAGSPAIPGGTWNLGDAPLDHPVFGTIYAPGKITYEDSLPEPNTDPTKTLSSVAPYSSFGFNVGVTYTFAKK